jgi:hypothetical protein
MPLRSHRARPQTTSVVEREARLTAIGSDCPTPDCLYGQAPGLGPILLKKRGT